MSEYNKFWVILHSPTYMRYTWYCGGKIPCECEHLNHLEPASDMLPLQIDPDIPEQLEQLNELRITGKVISEHEDINSCIDEFTRLFSDKAKQLN